LFRSLHHGQDGKEGEKKEREEERESRMISHPFTFSGYALDRGQRTVERHDFLDSAERVGSDASVVAEVVVVGDVDTQTQRQTVLRLVVDSL